MMLKRIHAMPTILAERLSSEANKKGFTQEKLAEAVGISREQCGKQLRRKGFIRINEDTARGYERVFSLSREELSKPPQVDKDTPSGWNRVVVSMSDEDLLILRMTVMRYGMDAHSVLQMSTALFVIVAELQLADRAKRLTDAETQIHNFPGGFDHMANAVHGLGSINEALLAEKGSIAARDLTGSTFSNDEWHDGFTGNTDLFEAFLERMLKELAPDVYEHQLGSPASDLFQDHIEDLTQGDALAKMVLLKNDVHPRELSNIPPEERVDFLHDRCSEATRAAHEKREAMLEILSLDLEFDGAADGGQTDA
jgi:transcriptional regulator with XRE-family HTH domain